MGLFKRFFKWGQSEANSAMDKLEDPIKMTEQGIRDLQKDLTASLQSLAEIKAVSIRLKRDAEASKEEAGDYERKAMMLLQKAKNGSMDSSEADRLATEALTKKEQASQRVGTLLKDDQKQQELIAKLEVNIKKLKSQISTWENELTTLKARAKTAKATRKLNEQLADIDSTSTIAMLEKMREKVSEEEALSESYGEIAATETRIDDEINHALADEGPSPSVQDALASLKSKLN